MNHCYKHKRIGFWEEVTRSYFWMHRWSICRLFIEFPSFCFWWFNYWEVILNIMNSNTCVPSHPELNFNSWPRDPLLCLPACLCVHKTVCLSVSLSACLFDRMPVCLYLSVCLLVCLSSCLSVRRSVCQSFCLFVCLVVRQSSCLSVRLSVCVSVTPETVNSG